MTRTLFAVAAIAVIGLPGAALAQDAPRGYGTLGYSRIETEQATLGAVTARGGWKLLSWAAIEAEAAVGVEDDAFEVSIGGTGGVIEFKHEVAAYAVAVLPLGDHVELFARAGGGSTTIEASTPAVEPFGNGESWNYGLGANVFYGSNGLRADWTRKDFTDQGGETDSWSLSYIRRF